METHLEVACGDHVVWVVAFVDAHEEHVEVVGQEGHQGCAGDAATGGGGDGRGPARDRQGGLSVRAGTEQLVHPLQYQPRHAAGAGVKGRALVESGRYGVHAL